MDDAHKQHLEAQLLLEAIHLRYGYDFRAYSRASIMRRIKRRLHLSKLSSISEMQYRLIYDESFFQELVLDFSISVTEMFRDPGFYVTLRREVIPKLLAFDHIKVWHAGCASGEEVYSMAILLREEGLYDRTQIYATDFNQVALQKARDGIYPVALLKEYSCNYQQAGGKASLADYYLARYDHVIMDQTLKQNIVFSDHNLTGDSDFGEMNLILCRNVLIYFTRELQDRVFRLFFSSLASGGFLCLGSKETVRFSSASPHFEDISTNDKIYCKR